LRRIEPGTPIVLMWPECGRRFEFRDGWLGERTAAESDLSAADISPVDKRVITWRLP
jgi:hypothetical protein